MISFLFIPIICIFSSCFAEIPVTRDFVAASEIKNGSTYIFTSLLDQSVITVHSNGTVTTELFNNSAEQKWKVVPHPSERTNTFEFKQEVVPYNALSGYQDSPENPGIFPRPLGLANRGIVGNQSTWNILIRRRWCLQPTGLGFPLDIDDCESDTTPGQLWVLEEVS